MNNLSTHTTSLELSKRLKELGFKQESLFYWSDPEGYNDWQPRIMSHFIERENENCKIYSAFLASELGEWLPYQIEGAWLWLQKDPPIQGGWAIVYSKNVEFDNPICIERGDTEANIRAKMLIYLCEKQIINPKTLSHE